LGDGPENEGERERSIRLKIVQRGQEKKVEEGKTTCNLFVAVSVNERRKPGLEKWYVNGREEELSQKCCVFKAELGIVCVQPAKSRKGGWGGAEGGIAHFKNRHLPFCLEEEKVGRREHRKGDYQKKEGGRKAGFQCLKNATFPRGESDSKVRGQDLRAQEGSVKFQRRGMLLDALVTEPKKKRNGADLRGRGEDYGGPKGEAGILCLQKIKTKF